MTSKDDVEPSGQAQTTIEKKPRGGNQRGSVASPKSNMEIGVIARKRVRSMIQVLSNVARDKEAPASARVSAAKALIGFAQIKPGDVRDLSDDEIRILAEKIVEKRSESKRDSARLLADPGGKLQ